MPSNYFRELLIILRNGFVKEKPFYAGKRSYKRISLMKWLRAIIPKPREQDSQNRFPKKMDKQIFHLTK